MTLGQALGPDPGPDPGPSPGPDPGPSLGQDPGPGPGQTRADEFSDISATVLGSVATGKFGSETKYLAKSGLSGPISEPKTAKTGETIQKIKKK